MAECSINTEYIDNYRIDDQYYYDDELMLSAGTQPRELIEKIGNLEFAPTDIGVASYPKAGTTLLQEILWLLRHNADEENAKLMNFERVPFIDDNYVDGIEKFYELKSPRHFKTHLPYQYLPRQVQKGETKLIYIYRNPKDTLVSFYHFYKSIIGLGFFTGTWHEYFQMFCRNGGILYYGNLLKHIRKYWEQRENKNLLITSYESLLKAPRAEIRRIADFAELDLDDILIDKVLKMTTFDVMSKNPSTNFECFADVCKFEVSPFMRKGKISDWKNYFTEDESAKLDDMIEKELGDTDIKFVYE